MTHFTKRLSKNLTWNLSAQQTVSKGVFDKLSFYDAPTNSNPQNPYAPIDRKTLEEKTKFLDFEGVSKKDQITILQEMIDACYNNPALAKLFRMPILHTEVRRKRFRSNAYGHYSFQWGTPSIWIHKKHMSEASAFVHEYAHATQEEQGLRFNEPAINALATFFMEAQAHAYDYFIHPQKSDDPLNGCDLLRKFKKEVQQQAAAGKLWTPANLTLAEKERYLTGVAMDKTMGALMEQYLSLPCDLPLRAQKNNSVGRKTTLAADHVTEFQYMSKGKEAYQAAQKYPYITQQLLDYYSATHQYNIEFSNPQKAPKEFEKAKIVIKKIAKYEKMFQQFLKTQAKQQAKGR